MADAAEPKKRTFRKFSYRGVDLDQLLDLAGDELVELFPARVRRRWAACQACRTVHVEVVSSAAYTA